MGLLKQYNASMDSWEVVGGITATTITEAIAAATSKTTPVTADLFFVSDSADGLGKKVTYGNLRTALFNSPTFVTPALGTPASGTLTNCTGLPIGGLTGLGANVATALGNTLNAASGLVGYSGVLGTPTSGTLTNCTGLPVGSLTGLGTGVSTGLTSAVNAASGFITYSGALGTPVGGTLTNCTGLPISGIASLATGMGTFLATPSSANLAATVTDETGSGSLVFATNPVLVTPNIGTPSAGTLTNCSGLPISGIASLGSNVGTFLATPSSANLRNAITDETGSGNLVFSNSPTFVTPTLGAASATSVAHALGAVGTPSITFTGDTNTGWYSPTADTIATTIGGVEVSRYTSTGSLLIGTTSNSASYKVVINNSQTDALTNGLSVSVSSTLTTTGTIHTNGITVGLTGCNVASGYSNDGNLYALNVAGYISSTSHQGTISNQFGTYSRSGIYSCGTGGTVTNSYAGYYEVLNSSANGTIVNAYGLYVANVGTTGTITNRWGVYQVGTLARNYYQGRSMFGGANTNNDATNIVQVYGSAKIQNGGISLLIGGDNGAITLTDATIKLGRIALHHYTNAEEPVGFLFGYMGATTNEISVGGGTSNVNAATLLKFYTAANNTTTMGTEAARITSNQNFMIGVTSETVAYRLQAVNNKTDADSYGIVGNAGVTLTANGTYASVGVMGNAITQNVASGLANASSATGVLGYGHVNSSSFAGTLTGSYGVRGYAGIYNCIAGTPTTTVTSAYGLFGYIYNNDADGTITNAYGCYIENAQTTGTITNRWGFYQVGASANNYFQASVNIGTTSPSASYMLQVSGTAKATRSLETAAALTPGATVTLDSSAGSYFTLIPAQTCQINATNPIAGQRLVLAITTSGTNSYTITFGTNFKSTGTLATGTVTAKVFVLTFACFDGTTFCEISRTTAM